MLGARNIGLACLVKDAQHAVQLSVHLSAQQGNLHDDAFVGEARHEGVGNTFLHHLTVAVAHLIVYVYHRFLDVAHAVTQQIDGYHRHAVAVVAHVCRALVLHAQVLPETQRFRLKPSLLQFYEHDVRTAVVLAHSG